MGLILNSAIQESGIQIGYSKRPGTDCLTFWDCSELPNEVLRNFPFDLIPVIGFESLSRIFDKCN